MLVPCHWCLNYYIATGCIPDNSDIVDSRGYGIDLESKYAFTYLLIILYGMYILGWAKISKLLRIKKRIQPLMPIGLQSIHTKFQLDSCEHLVAKACWSQSGSSTYRQKFKILFLAEIEILLCKGHILIILNYSVLRSDQNKWRFISKKVPKFCYIAKV